MKRNIYLYLFVFSALIAIFIYFNFKAVVDQQKSQIEQLQNKVERLQDENRNLLKEIEEI
ncbi:hypothetical protein SAMN05444278_105135 [Psychroflexus salarius]|jgi:uncharacterized membrane protein (DUF106 family)|uniref:Uncharacterized protein n=1 Tax=Psychroflexus salarius TaxID=1155689 RepID=A0A1M4W807_9FLAO|nr:hypothetical protein [Psychroflexus salarius]SHE77404.1 hypothetical protein SAMN05444278_105135 [Psychroflexus salarius]